MKGKKGYYIFKFFGLIVFSLCCSRLWSFAEVGDVPAPLSAAPAPLSAAPAPLPGTPGFESGAVRSEDEAWQQAPMSVAPGSESDAARPDSDFVYFSEVNGYPGQFDCRFSRYLFKKLWPQIFGSLENLAVESNGAERYVQGVSNRRISNVVMGIDTGDGDIFYTADSVAKGIVKNMDECPDFKTSGGGVFRFSCGYFNNKDLGKKFVAYCDKIRDLRGRNCTIALFVDGKLVRKFNVKVGDEIRDPKDINGFQTVYQPSKKQQLSGFASGGSSFLTPVQFGPFSSGSNLSQPLMYGSPGVVFSNSASESFDQKFAALRALDEGLLKHYGSYLNAWRSNVDTVVSDAIMHLCATSSIKFEDFFCWLLSRFATNAVSDPAMRVDFWRQFWRQINYLASQLESVVPLWVDFLKALTPGVNFSSSDYSRFREIVLSSSGQSFGFSGNGEFPGNLSFRSVVGPKSQQQQLVKEEDLVVVDQYPYVGFFKKKLEEKIKKSKSGFRGNMIVLAGTGIQSNKSFFRRYKIDERNKEQIFCSVGDKGKRKRVVVNEDKLIDVLICIVNGAAKGQNWNETLKRNKDLTVFLVNGKGVFYAKAVEELIDNLKFEDGMEESID